MANSEKYGVGVSYRTDSGTLIWVFRSEWAEVLTDLGAMYGPDAVLRLNTEMAEAFGDGKSTIAQALAPQPRAQQAAPVYTPPAPAPAQAAESSEQQFELCPACGAEKNRWVPPGVSSKTGKKYPGFFGCPTRGCSGR